MKRIFLISTVFLAFITTSCSVDSPKSVAEKFLTAMENQDFEEAKKYSDESMKQLLNVLNEMPKDDNKKTENPKIKVTKVEKEGDKAKVFYMVEGGGETEGENKEQSIDLKKIDGKWKVSFNKEDANKEAPQTDSESMNSEDEMSEESTEAESEDLDSDEVSPITE